MPPSARLIGDDTATIVAWNPAPRRQFTGSHQLLGNPILADVEVLNAALGLRAPVTVGRHFQRSQAVGLPAAPVCSTTNGAANRTTPLPCV